MCFDRYVTQQELASLSTYMTARLSLDKVQLARSGWSTPWSLYWSRSGPHAWQRRVYLFLLNVQLDHMLLPILSWLTSMTYGVLCPLHMPSLGSIAEGCHRLAT